MKVDIAAKLSYEIPEPADILLAIEAIPMADQTLVTDLLTVTGTGPMTPVPGIDGLGQRSWLYGSGPLEILYTATVDLNRAPTRIEGLNPPPHPQLPNMYIPYLMPSRYAPSDQLETFVRTRFDAPDAGTLIMQMRDWIHESVAYVSGSSGFTTTASDTFVSRRGVCRDFAHLLIAFARAADIPARMVSAYALGLEPPDFHAVVEVYLDGRWHLVDPTRLVPETNLVRIGVGRDASDVGFMTIFGEAIMLSQSVTVTQA